MSNKATQPEKGDIGGSMEDSAGAVATGRDGHGKPGLHGQGYDGVDGHASQIHVDGHAKYAKIQPAIAIKPKPQTANTAFNPNSGVSSLKTSISLNINTSKNWVLPPRPRPGRKPTYTAEEASLQKEVSQTAPESKNGKSSQKKKLRSLGLRKGSPTSTSPVPLPEVAQPIELSNNDKSATSGERVPRSIATPPSATVCSPPVAQDDRREIERKNAMGSKYTYLNKLREQDLIRSYIDIINNQIKELKFVQNGLITFDTLNSDQNEPSSIRKKMIERNSLAHEQLENINNINDLNKSIAYYIKSSNSIQNVSRKVANQDSHVDIEREIEFYSKLRSERKSKNDELKKSHRSKQPGKMTITNNIGIGSQNDFSTPMTKIASKDSFRERGEGFDVQDGKSIFTPSLMKPLSIPYMYESDDDLNEILNNSSKHQGVASFSQENVDKLILNDSDLFKVDPNNTIPDIPMNSMIDNFFNSKTQDDGKKKTKVDKNRKSSCGFCTNGTPCMCLDAEVELRNLTKIHQFH